MPISVKCPHCARQFRVADAHAGRSGKCPGCGQALTVPGPPPAAPEKPATRPRPPAKSTPPPVPQIAVLLGDRATPAALFAPHAPARLPRRGADDLPLPWLRNLLYDRLNWPHFGTFLDAALTSIRDGDAPRATMPDVPGSDDYPPDAAEAIRTASLAGFLTAPIDGCLAAGRFKVHFDVMLVGTSLGAFLRAVPMGILSIYVILGLLLPVWGLKWLCRWLPGAFRRWLLRWNANASFVSRLLVGPLLWFAGLTAGVWALTLSAYTVFWPPLLLRLLSATGDFVLVTGDALVLYSGASGMAARVPKGWPVYEGRFGRYFIVLGYENERGVESFAVCVAKLPPEWVEEQELRTEELGRFVRRRLSERARLLARQIGG